MVIGGVVLCSLLGDFELLSPLSFEFDLALQATLSSKPPHKPGCKPSNWLDIQASWLAGYWLAGLGAAANARQLAGTSWQISKPVAS